MGEVIARAVLFARAVHLLVAAARAASLSVPAFRAPPRIEGAVRTVARYKGGVTVAVVIRERPVGEWLGDMVDGLLEVNGIGGNERMRAALLDAVSTIDVEETT
jgi:hypothetical protein